MVRPSLPGSVFSLPYWRGLYREQWLSVKMTPRPQTSTTKFRHQKGPTTRPRVPDACGSFEVMPCPVYDERDLSRTLSRHSHHGGTLSELDGFHIARSWVFLLRPAS